MNKPNTPQQDQMPEAVIEQRQINIPFPESFLYANCAAFSIGQNEIRIGFAEAMQDGRAVSKVGVVLPPETAAVVALILFKQVTLFESNFGEIRHPMWKKMKADAGSGPFPPQATKQDSK